MEKEETHFSFSNDRAGKTGIVTFAIKPARDEFAENPEIEADGAKVLLVGYFLTPPDPHFNRAAAEHGASEAVNSRPNGRACIVMVGRPEGEAREYTVRLAWQTGGKSSPGIPGWAKKLDLAQNAVLI